jgi:alpha-L-arabinofuranosidase
VHVPAQAVTQTITPAQTLTDDGYHVDSTHYHGSGAAVVQGQGVALAYVSDNSGYDCLLADAEVHLTRDRAVMPELRDPLLEESASQHEAVQAHLIWLHVIPPK